MIISDLDKLGVEALKVAAPNGGAAVITVDEETGEPVSLSWRDGKLIRKVINEPDGKEAAI